MTAREELISRLRAEAREVYEWSNAPGDRYARHSHAYTKILYCLEGSIEFILDDRRIALEAGDRMELPAGTSHAAVVGERGVTCAEGKQRGKGADPSRRQLMNTGIEVRRIRAEEWPELRDLRLRALVDSPTAFGSTFETEGARPDDHWRERARRSADGIEQVLVVVAADGALRGMARGVTDEGGAAFVHLYGMYVDPEMRGRGHGRALVEAVCAWARSRGSRRVVLNVTVTNLPAISLYEACGFVRTGTVQPLPHTPTLLEIEMARELGVRPTQ